MYFTQFYIQNPTAIVQLPVNQIYTQFSAGKKYLPFSNKLP